jgi:iron(III) transport system ATP-binding protein
MATVRIGDAELRVPAPRVKGSDASLVVRSAGLDLAPVNSNGANGAGGSALTATVRKATYLGSHWEYTLETAVGSLFVTQPIGRRFAPDSSVALRFNPEHLSLVERA